MTDYSMSQPAVLYQGGDAYQRAKRADGIYFEELDTALRYAVERLPRTEKLGSYLRLDSGEILRWDELVRLYVALRRADTDSGREGGHTAAVAVEYSRRPIRPAG